MPDSIRRQLQAALATLVAGLATSGARVYSMPAGDQPRDSLPGLFIWSGDEEIEAVAMGGRQGRTLVLAVDAVADAASAATLDATLETMAQEVETAVFGGVASLLALSKRVELIGIEKPPFEDDGERPVGRIQISFQVYYETQEGAPTTAI